MPNTVCFVHHFDAVSVDIFTSNSMLCSCDYVQYYRGFILYFVADVIESILRDRDRGGL